MIKACVEELVTRYESNAEMPLLQHVKVLDGKSEAPTGSFFAWLPVPVGFTSEKFADYLLEIKQM